ncbi:TIGR03915 family putative DNA repair protein [Anaerovorax odorimutans]|uniref:TIGR03915 family putative DNA repair protein n=1 Tax=Anaerovorax odorimutans TaxID=109327 RepID=A0ABT1RNJ6_9FIRM|nr:TIGR03915 family putative DNA repair protein [Anaerovorax odorimutans]MCQ4636768.1 TIGR03915 family putative DNA repair protein [Anaerovorax odorimutans]
MVDYLYDGTFEGLLTCIYHHYYTEKASGIFRREEYQSTMLGGYKEIETEEEKAITVYEAIEKKISSDDLKRIYKVFMSGVEGKETKILNYVRLGFVKGSCVSMLHGEPIVFAVQQAERKVNGEVHRMKGLIRFSELGNKVLYSSIEPDHDIVEFLADHFCDRFKNEPFIIHDLKRSKALIAYQGSWYISEFTEKELSPLSEEEKEYRRLWKSYFENMAIRERINPRCQKNLMPVRYWKHLTEFQL